MRQYDIRYLFEHQIMPNCFFEEQLSFVVSVLNNHGLIFRLIDAIFENEGVKNPYTEEDFEIETVKISDEVMMLKVKYPEPEEEPLCYCSYMFFDLDFEKVNFFCIEKGMDDDEPFVCGWTQDGTHVNYGHCSFENLEDFFTCARLHITQFGLVQEDDQELVN